MNHYTILILNSTAVVQDSPVQANEEGLSSVYEGQLQYECNALGDVKCILGVVVVVLRYPSVVGGQLEVTRQRASVVVQHVFPGRLLPTGQLRQVHGLKMK